MVMYLKNNMPFFSQIDHVSLRSISRCFKIQHYKQGTQIITKGEVADRFYVNLKGQCGIYLDSESPVKIVRECGHFGERALQRELTKRDASVRAETDCILAYIERGEFLDRVFSFLHNQRLERINYLEELELTKGWT